MNGAIHLAQGAPVYGFFDRGASNSHYGDGSLGGARGMPLLRSLNAGWGAGLQKHVAPTELARGGLVIEAVPGRFGRNELLCEKGHAATDATPLGLISIFGGHPG